jgi:hypothetical protein
LFQEHQINFPKTIHQIHHQLLIEEVIALIDVQEEALRRYSTAALKIMAQAEINLIITLIIQTVVHSTKF